MVTMHLCHAPPMQIFCRSDLLAISLRPGGAVTEDRGFPVDAGPQDSTRLNPAKLTRDRGGVDEAGWRRRRPPRNKSSRAIVDDFSSAPMAVPHIARGRVGQRGVQRGLLDKLHQSGIFTHRTSGPPNWSRCRIIPIADGDDAVSLLLPLPGFGYQMRPAPQR